jgi:tetratricopeptide (TPR) repeat protein
LVGKRAPLPKVRPPITKEVEAIVDKSLAIDKHDRFPTATQFAEAIERVHDSGKQVIVAHYVGDSRAKRKFVYAGVAAAAVVAIAVGSTLWNGRKEESRAVPSLHAGSDTVQELVRRGKIEGARRTASGSARAISLFMQAVAKDSMAPAAWAELAYAAEFANSRALPIPGISRDSLMSLAVAASERAVALDPDNATSWLIKARTSRMMDPTDLRPALFGIRKALSIDSTNARGWFDLGTVRMESLDNAGSFAAWKKSADLNPTDPQTLSFIGLNRLWAHDYQEGIRWADSAIALDPMYRLARESKGQLLVEAGHPLEAVQQYEIAMRSAAGSETAISFGLIARAYAVGGDNAKARENVERAMKLVDISKPPRHEAAWVGAALAAVGDTVRAVRLLEAYQPRADRHFQMHLLWDPGLRWIKGSKWEKDLMLPAVR